MPGKLILPCLLYFINYLDRLNIGFAGPDGMSEELELGATFSGLLINAIPYALGAVTMIGVGQAWRPHRGTEVARCAAMVAVCAIGVRAALPTFRALPTSFLGGTAAAGGIALINSLSNVSGFAGTQKTGL